MPTEKQGNENVLPSHSNLETLPNEQVVCDSGIKKTILERQEPGADTSSRPVPSK